MNCLFCGNELKDDAKFCTRCGKQVEVKAEAYNVVADTLPADQGEAKEDTFESVNVAQGFNQNVRQYYPNTYYVPAKKGKKKGFMIAISSVLAASILAGSIFAFGFSGDKKAKAGNTYSGNYATEAKPFDTNEVTITPEITATPVTPTSTPTPTDTAYKDETESLKKVFGYIEEAEAAIKADATKLSGVKGNGEKARILSLSINGLKSIKSKAVSVVGINTNAKEAVNAYFDMVITAKEKRMEVHEFFAKYVELYNSTIKVRPNLKDTKVSTHAVTLKNWYNQVNTGLAGFTSIPTSVRAAWDEYKKVFSVNADIANKENAAVSYNDWLRYYSSMYLNVRYETVEKLAYDALEKSVNDEISFSAKQLDAASKLAEEFKKYIYLGEAERNSYKFKEKHVGAFNYSIEYEDVIYPALYNSYNYFVALKAGCYTGTRTVVVEAEIPGFTQKFKNTYTLDSSYTKIAIKPSPLTGNVDLNAAKQAQMNISIYEKDGVTLIKSESHPITIKSRNDVEWITDEYGVSTQDNILCFLTPESEKIANLKRSAIEVITKMTKGKMENLPGYQEVAYNHYVVTYLQAAGIMRAMYENGVRYNMDGFSISGSNQHVLMPDQVLSTKSGLCIETSLVVASALQSANMHTFLVFPPGHAQVAVEIWNKGVGTGEYFLIETTALSESSNNTSLYVKYANQLLKGTNNLTKSGPITYLNAEQWKEYLGNCQYVIDCNDSRVLGLTPFFN